jgi:hypothetical protein
VRYTFIKIVDAGYPTLKNGFYKIKNLDTGGLSSTRLTYGPGKIEGVDAVRVDQLQKGKIVKLGVSPCRHIL